MASRLLFVHGAQCAPHKFGGRCKKKNTGLRDLGVSFSILPSKRAMKRGVAGAVCLGLRTVCKSAPVDGSRPDSKHVLRGPRFSSRTPRVVKSFPVWKAPMELPSF